MDCGDETPTTFRLGTLLFPLLVRLLLFTFAIALVFLDNAITSDVAKLPFSDGIVYVEKEGLD